MTPKIVYIACSYNTIKKAMFNFFKKAPPAQNDHQTLIQILTMVTQVMTTLAQTQSDLSTYAANAEALKTANAALTAQVADLTAQLAQANTEAADLQAIDDQINAANAALIS